MKRWLIVMTLVSVVLLSAISTVAAKGGKTDPSGPIYPGGIFFLD